MRPRRYDARTVPGPMPGRRGRRSTPELASGQRLGYRLPDLSEVALDQSQNPRPIRVAAKTTWPTLYDAHRLLLRCSIGSGCPHGPIRCSRPARILALWGLASFRGAATRRDSGAFRRAGPDISLATRSFRNRGGSRTGASFPASEAGRPEDQQVRFSTGLKAHARLLEPASGPESRPFATASGFYCGGMAASPANSAALMRRRCAPRVTLRAASAPV